jgi:hypothetical protein
MKEKGIRRYYLNQTRKGMAQVDLGSAPEDLNVAGALTHGESERGLYHIEFVAVVVVVAAAVVVVVAGGGGGGDNLCQTRFVDVHLLAI